MAPSACSVGDGERAVHGMMYPMRVSAPCPQWVESGRSAELQPGYQIGRRVPRSARIGAVSPVIENLGLRMYGPLLIGGVAAVVLCITAAARSSLARERAHDRKIRLANEHVQLLSGKFWWNPKVNAPTVSQILHDGRQSPNVLGIVKALSCFTICDLYRLLLPCGCRAATGEQCGREKGNPHSALSGLCPATFRSRSSPSMAR